MAPGFLSWQGVHTSSNLEPPSASRVSTRHATTQKSENASPSLFVRPPPQDPKAKKPEDWDERAEIADPEDKKPEGWDDIPATIPDKEAKKPEDWDEEEDGTWEPPMIPNPEYKGEWKPKMIKNPAYKGVWVAPDIDNPEYKHDDKLYNYKDLKFVGFELWQVGANGRTAKTAAGAGISACSARHSSCAGRALFGQFILASRAIGSSVLGTTVCSNGCSQ